MISEIIILFPGFLHVYIILLISVLQIYNLFNFKILKLLKRDFLLKFILNVEFSPFFKWYVEVAFFNHYCVG